METIDLALLSNNIDLLSKTIDLPSKPIDLPSETADVPSKTMIYQRYHGFPYTHLHTTSPTWIST